VADAELLAAHTHKFESRYLDGLMGPYPAAKDVYVKRSPIHSVDKINAPVILFQVGGVGAARCDVCLLLAGGAVFAVRLRGRRFQLGSLPTRLE